MHAEAQHDCVCLLRSQVIKFGLQWTSGSIHNVAFIFRVCASHVQSCCLHCVSAIAVHCRERASGVYGTPAYFTATVLFDLIPMRVLPPCFFAAATYWMVGLRPGLWHLLTFLLLLVLSNMVGTLSSLFSPTCLW